MDLNEEQQQAYERACFVLAEDKASLQRPEFDRQYRLDLREALEEALQIIDQLKGGPE